MKVLLVGLCGHMGQNVINTINTGKFDCELVAGVDPFAKGDECVPCTTSFADANADVDIIVDFSHHSMTVEMTKFAVANGLPLLIATTGQTEDELAAINEAAKSIPVFFAGNYSIGIALLCEMAKKTAAVFPDANIEIVETHHNRKIDAPSGTALALFNAIKESRPNATANMGRSGQMKRTEDEIGIQSIRLGDIVGIHEVIISTGAETITLKHEAHSRALFAEGALVAAKFLASKPAGLYKMTDMVKF